MDSVFLFIPENENIMKKNIFFFSFDTKSPDFSPITPASCTKNNNNNNLSVIRETEDCHQNDRSQIEQTSPGDTRKKRGRPPKDKLPVKSDMIRKVCTDDEFVERCNPAHDVCHECGTLRKDYGRDTSRMNR